MTPWTTAHQAPPSMGFSRQEYWKEREVAQSCLTLCDPMDGSPPGSPLPGILQARTLEWVAISFPNAWKWKVKEPTRLLHPWDFPGKSTGVGCNCITNHSNSYKCSLSGKVCKLFTSGQILTFFSALLKIVLHDNNKNNYYKNYFTKYFRFLCIIWVNSYKSPGT